MSTGMAQSANTLSLSTTRSHVRYPRAAGAGEHDASAVKVCARPPAAAAGTVTADARALPIPGAVSRRSSG